MMIAHVRMRCLLLKSRYTIDDGPEWNAMCSLLRVTLVLANAIFRLITIIMFRSCVQPILRLYPREECVVMF